MRTAVQAAAIINWSIENEIHIISIIESNDFESNCSIVIKSFNSTIQFVLIQFSGDSISWLLMARKYLIGILVCWMRICNR